MNFLYTLRWAQNLNDRQIRIHRKSDMKDFFFTLFLVYITKIKQQNPKLENYTISKFHHWQYPKRINLIFFLRFFRIASVSAKFKAQFLILALARPIKN